MRTTMFYIKGSTLVPAWPYFISIYFISIDDLFRLTVGELPDVEFCSLFFILSQN